MSVDPIDVWIEHLRSQARDAQWWAEKVAKRARCLRGAPRAIAEVQVDAHRAGIIAREARRQYQAALDAAPLARIGAMAGNGTTYDGMGQVIMALVKVEP